MGKTLREWCMDNGFDCGNMSRIERGILPPPQSPKIIARYAKALGFKKGTGEWSLFFDLAAIEAGRLPAILTNQEIVSRLPVICGVLRKLRDDPRRLDSFIEAIRRM